jgi:Mg2+/Co2+ transporter CorC
MNDFYRVLEIEGEEFEEEKGDSDTLAGFILEIHGKIPKRNEKIYFKNYLFVIEAADSRKITSLKLTILEEENNDKKFEE